MEDTTRISFSAVTHIGAACTVNDDRIYANGKFMNPSIADYSQITLETNGSKCLFAVSDGMEDEDSGISIINDLRKFHQKAQNSSKDIHVKLDEMVQCVEQASNLMHSISLGDNDFRERKTAFAGILIDEGSIAAVNLGNCRVYKLEGDTFKLMVNDYKRAERLLKMGIISSEQAELLSGQQKASMEEGRSTVKKSDIHTLREGTVYLICSSGLTDAVSEDAIYDILASSIEPDEAAGKLVAEAVKNEGEDNITAMVIKVEEAEEAQVPYPSPRATQSRSSRSSRSGKTSARMGSVARAGYVKTIDMGKVVGMAVLVILAVAVLLGGFKLWTILRNPAEQGTVSQNGTQPENTGDTTTPSTSDEGLDEDEFNETETTSEGAIDTGEGEEAGGESENTDLVGPEGTTYVVQSGDMLMKISVKFYGDESKYKLIMDANKITDPNKIAVGQELIIPPLP